MQLDRLQTALSTQYIGQNQPRPQAAKQQLCLALVQSQQGMSTCNADCVTLPAAAAAGRVACAAYTGDLGNQAASMLLAAVNAACFCERSSWCHVRVVLHRGSLITLCP